MHLAAGFTRRPAAWAIAAAVVLCASAAGAQVFTRVTDPTNPAVTDALESGGAFWIDLVGDGPLDLFVPNGNLSNQPNTLYRNTRAGSFVRVVTGAITTDGGSSIGGAFGDYDGDGRPDLFVTNRNNFGNFLYRGLGDTLFDKVTAVPPVTDIANSNSSSWVDVDGDGDLDLYVVNFSGPDYLYVNSGAPAFAFTRVDTTALTPGSEFSIPGAWADYNDDGLPDLFVGNAGVQSDYVYTNHGHLWFTRTVIADGRSTLGASWGDYDNDGRLDLIVAHYQNQKSTLYHNGGPPAFTLVPQDTALVSTLPGFWVGTAWGDYDDDGWLDLVMADDGNSEALFHNEGPPGFGLSRVTTGPVVTSGGNSFGCAWGDYDADGRLDLYVANRANQLNFLFHNDGGNANHGVDVRCTGAAPNASAIGARLTLWATIDGVSRPQYREVTSQTGYNSGNLDQHFGLGTATAIDSLRVRWPSGRSEVWVNPPAVVLLRLAEGAAPVSVPSPGSRAAAALEVRLVSANPARGAATLRLTLPRAGRARLDWVDLAGRRVATVFDRDFDAGVHDVQASWPRGQAAGVLFGRLTQDGREAVVRVVALR